MWQSRKKTLIAERDEARRRLAELEAWKRSRLEAEASAQVVHVELTGEILNTLRRTAFISQRARQMLGRMATFDADFDAAARDLGAIDGQIGSLTDSVASTGSAIHQSSAAVEQMTAQITRISEESTSRFQDIRHLAELSKSGQTEMEATLRVIQQVTEGIDDLRDFLEIIDDIAGKTAILSMNAAIQAAHAGEVGKGFAVVADEVRRLAESSASNAAAIARNLNGLIEVIHQAEASSLRTASILAESESKVGKATAGFQEIEQGARELAVGGREMLEGVSVLRTAASSTTATSERIAQNSRAITGRVSHLRSESKAIESALEAVRVDSADLNGAGLSLSETTIRQLSASRDPGAGLDPVLVSILTLQHLALVTRVRSVLDGATGVEARPLADAQRCELGRWLQKEGKESLGAEHHAQLHGLHEAFHRQVGAVLALGEASSGGIEADFTELLAQSDALVAALRQAANRGRSAVLIEWGPAFELGHSLIDAQHHRLVDLTNRLYASIQEGAARSVLGEVLQELVEYTVTHFRDEEALFQASSYPGKKGHLNQHQKFIETVTALQADFRAGKAVLGSQAVEFLRDWLLQHIQGSDRGYVAFL